MAYTGSSGSPNLSAYLSFPLRLCPQRLATSSHRSSSAWQVVTKPSTQHHPNFSASLPCPLPAHTGRRPAVIAEAAHVRQQQEPGVPGAAASSQGGACHGSPHRPHGTANACPGPAQHLGPEGTGEDCLSHVRFLSYIYIGKWWCAGPRARGGQSLARSSPAQHLDQKAQLACGGRGRGQRRGRRSLCLTQPRANALEQRRAPLSSAPNAGGKVMNDSTGSHSNMLVTPPAPLCSSCALPVTLCIAGEGRGGGAARRMGGVRGC